jgi:hypothetical protein
MSLAHRLGQLERRLPRAGGQTYVVAWQPAETPEQAIERAAPTRGFALIPVQCSSMEEWTAQVGKELADELA